MHGRRGQIQRGDTNGERGASLVEYALLVALIAVVCIVAVTFLGKSGKATLDKAGDGVSSIPFNGVACPVGYNIDTTLTTCIQQR